MNAAARHPRGSAAIAVAMLVGNLFVGAAALARPSADVFQSSFEAGQPLPLKPATNPEFTADVAGGPNKAAVLTAKPGVGFTGLHSLHYRGGAGGSQQQMLFHVDLAVQPDTQLS